MAVLPCSAPLSLRVSATARRRFEVRARPLEGRPAQAVLPKMIRQRSGKRINLASLGGQSNPLFDHFTMTAIPLGKVSISEFSRAVWPFLIALTIALFLVTYSPALAMWLPNLLLPVK